MVACKRNDKCYKVSMQMTSGKEMMSYSTNEVNKMNLAKEKKEEIFLSPISISHSANTLYTHQKSGKNRRSSQEEEEE